jgi:hypothetical protein
VTFEALCNRDTELRNRSNTGIDKRPPHAHFADLRIAGNSWWEYTMLQIACSLKWL